MTIKSLDYSCYASFMRLLFKEEILLLESVICFTSLFSTGFQLIHVKRMKNKNNEDAQRGHAQLFK